MSAALTQILAEVEELHAAAKTAAQNGMFESGAALRNKAAGLLRAAEILRATDTIKTEVECLVEGGGL